MTFLNPAVLFGLFAASIPIILHFLNLRKLKKIEFSTLSFLKELQKSKIRRIKLKQWLLLLLRILIIICIVIAFARPSIKTTTFNSSSSKTSAVFIIDNSFSMSVVSNGGSYFNKSKQIARDILSNLSIKDEIAILPTIFQPDYDYKLKSNRAIINNEIEQLRISNVFKPLHNSIIKAGQLLFQSKNINKEVYIFSDLQSGTIYERENDVSKISELFSNVKFFWINFNRKSTRNAGIEKLELANQIFEMNKSIGVEAVVKNYGEDKLENSVVSLFVNGKRNAQQSFSLVGDESKNIIFETNLSDTGFVNLSVELEDDDINNDNKRFAGLFMPVKINILLISETEEEIQFIKYALASSSSSVQINRISYSQLPSTNLNRYNAIISLEPGFAVSLSKIKEYIENRGGVIFFPGKNSTQNSLNNFFKQINITSPFNFIGQINSGDNPSQFNSVEMNHPLFRDLFDDNKKTRIESPDIFYYSRVIPGAAGRTIISMFDNSAFLSEYKSGGRKILLYNTLPTLSWNNLPLKSIFPALIYKSILYLTSSFKEHESQYCGNELFVNVSLTNLKPIKVLRPDETTEVINTSQNKIYNYSKTDLPGNYQFNSGGKLIDYFSVNLDPKESVVTYLAESDLTSYLQKIGFNSDLSILEEGKNYFANIEKARLGKELWRYFILIALFLTIVEMLLSRSSKNDLSQG